MASPRPGTSRGVLEWSGGHGFPVGFLDALARSGPGSAYVTSGARTRLGVCRVTEVRLRLRSAPGLSGVCPWALWFPWVPNGILGCPAPTWLRERSRNFRCAHTPRCVSRHRGAFASP